MKHPCRRRSVLGLAALASTVTVVGLAAARLASTAAESDQRVAFRTTAGVHGVLNTTILGTAPGVTAAEKDGRLTFLAPVARLDTGISMRNRHLRERLHADQYPNIILVVDRKKLKAVGDNQTVSGSATGELTLAGTSRALPFTYQASRTGTDYHLTASFVVNINDFGVATPCFAGVCVDPKVMVTVERYKLREM